MKLILENIGNIGKAVIEINGITVIAGENNTGKSTISRALFSVFNGFCQIEKKIRLERINGIRRLLVLLFQNQLLNIRVHDILEIANRIITHIDLYRNNIEKMKHEYRNPNRVLPLESIFYKKGDKSIFCLIWSDLKNYISEMYIHIRKKNLNSILRGN